MEHTTVPQMCTTCNLLPLVGRPRPTPLRASPAQFVLLISHPMGECNAVQRDYSILYEMQKELSTKSAKFFGFFSIANIVVGFGNWFIMPPSCYLHDLQAYF